MQAFLRFLLATLPAMTFRLSAISESNGEGPAWVSRSRPSFTSRVDAFWTWFAADEQRLFDQLQANELDAEELIDRIRSAAPMLAWELCPSPEDGKEGFALSSEGDSSKRFLVNFMIQRAPELQRWTLYSSKQASPDIAQAMVNLDEDEDFAFADFRFGIAFDKESEQLEVQVHHPKFSVLPEDARMQLTFLALDNALGENLVESWIGGVQATPDRTPDQKHTIDELRRQAKAALRLYELDPELDPIERWSAYSVQDENEIRDGDEFPRGDVHSGSTCNMDLLYALDDPEPEDEFEGSGATFAYLVLPIQDFEQERVVEQRTEIENALIAKLREASAGDVFGSALGFQYVYLDLVLFDVPTALPCLRDALAGFSSLTRARICSFYPQQGESVELLGG